jgi:carbamoyltransferase
VRLLDVPDLHVTGAPPVNSLAGLLPMEGARRDAARSPRVLGLSFFFHDSAAALVCDGRIVAAAAEERFCRRKHTNEFPKLAIEYCLEAGHLRSVNDLDAVVFYEKPILKLHRLVESLVHAWPRGLTTFTRGLPRFLTSKFNVYDVIQRALPAYTGPILFTEHHMSHAASAFYCSPFDEAAILTVDGVGEWETTTIGVGSGADIELRRSIHFPHSIGLLYSALTSYLGFHVNDGEWKVMGLAPYGEPRYLDAFRRLVRMHEDGSFELDMDYFVHNYSSQWSANHACWEAAFGFPRRQPREELAQHHEDLARSGQAVVEDLILNLARAARRLSGSDNLVIAGGVGLNSVANWRIERQGIFRRVWIQPAAGDDGGALGAALFVSQQLFNGTRCEEMTDAYLGPEYSPEEIDDALEAEGLDAERLDDQALVERTADLIAEGKVVGWFRGRMEFGPRALGSRSILADATNPAMKEIINRKIKYREYFRPFAPAVPLEDVHRYFDVEPGTSMPFMLKVPLVRPDMRARIPAVTHQDGTGRVQTVTCRANPLYYALLRAVERRTGVPIIVNTSFNVRGEPIVCSPRDALRCFLETGIDALVLGNSLLTDKPDAEAHITEGYARSDALEAELGDDDAPRRAVARPDPHGRAVVTRPAVPGDWSDTTDRVLGFYRQLPFNYYSSAVDEASELVRANRVRSYPSLHRFLKKALRPSVLDVGCGAGWFANSCAHFYGAEVMGVDLNPVALRQAKSVARFIAGSADTEFVETDLFSFAPNRTFDVVNSLGVLHHTPDCHEAIRRVVRWIVPGGYLHLGLYHRHGRQPFLDHFKVRIDRGESEDQLLEEFRRLNPDITDETHMRSWFRDQVLHPHESLHTYPEIDELLRDCGCVIEATSLNGFGALPSASRIAALEESCETASRKALRPKGRYYPGFFVVWARRASS